MPKVIKQTLVSKLHCLLAESLVACFLVIVLQILYMEKKYDLAALVIRMKLKLLTTKDSITNNSLS